MDQHRLLVTGLNGFVGSALAKRVAQHAQSQSITLAGLTRPDGSAINIRDVDRVNEAVASFCPTALIHLAAIASPRDAAGAPDEAWAVNVMGTFNLAHAVRIHAPQARFIFAGSSEAYGQSFALHTPLNEDTALSPISVYGATKAAADLMLSQMAHEGVRATRFRPFNHTGPGQTAAYVASAFARQIVRIERGWQEPVMQVGNLEAKRDFLDVRDIVDAYLLAALGTSNETIDVFNLATGAPVAVSEILDLLVGQARVPIEITQDPRLMRPSDLAVISGDTAKAAQILGWQACIPLPETLRDVLGFWRATADERPSALQD